MYRACRNAHFRFHGANREVTGSSPVTTTRDLTDLVSKGALTREGELRHARYRLNLLVGAVRQVKVNEQDEVVEVELQDCSQGQRVKETLRLRQFSERDDSS